MNIELLELDHLDDSERVQLIKDRTLEVFDDNKIKSERWLNSPIQALNYRSPIAYADTVEGAKEVLSLINRLEHGIFT